MWIFDKLQNLISGLGTSKDGRTNSSYVLQPLTRDQLEKAYRSDWLAKKIVDAPALDMTREWRQWQASQKQIEAIEATEKAHDLQRKLKLALIKARLYGGAALVMGVEQGDSDEPLDVEAVGRDQLKFVVVLHRYELMAGPRIYNVDSPWYTRPEYYTVSSPMFGFSFEGGATQPATERGDKARQVLPPSGMINVHPSRVIEFSGNELPDWRLAPLGGGWGDSVLQTIDDTIRDTQMVANSIAAMVNDGKVDVVKIPEFSDQMKTQEYSDRLLRRFAFANQAKSTVNSLILDKDEEWERIVTRFNGLPEVMREFLLFTCGAAGIPVSRVIGQAYGKGLGGSGGDHDLRNYYDDVASHQKTVNTPALEPLDRVVVQSALGKYDPNVHYTWNPLWQMDTAEKATIAKDKATALQTLVGTALLNEDALRKAVVNQLIEDGTYPGLDDAIEEYGAEPVQPQARLWSPSIDPRTGLPLGGSGGGDPLGLPSPRQFQDAAPRSLYVRRDVLNADEIRKWAKDQGFPSCVPADQMHVTVIYSKEPVDWMKVGSSGSIMSSDKQGRLEIPPGGARLLDKMGLAVALLFSSSELSWRHQDIRRAGAESDYPDYQPHVSITFEAGDFDWQHCEPYRGAILLGPEIFEEIYDDVSWRSRFQEDGR